MISSALLSVLLAWPAAAQADSPVAKKPAVEAGLDVERLLRKVYDPKPPDFDELVRSLTRLGPGATEELVAIYVGAVEPPRPPENSPAAPAGLSIDEVLHAALKALPPGDVVAAVRARAMGEIPIQVRANGFQVLGSVGTTRAMETLLDSAKELSDFQLAHPALRESGSAALASILAGSAQGWDELERRSTKLPPGVERIVARGVGRSGSPRGFAVLMRFLARPGADRAALFESIEELSLKSAPWIEERDRVEIRFALGSMDPDIQCRAAFILGRAHDAPSVPDLLDLLESEDTRVQLAATWALESISSRSFPGESERWRDWHAEQVEWQNRALPELRKQLEANEPEVVVAAIAQICQRPLFRHELAEDLSRVLARGRPEVAVAACAGLAELRSPRAVPELVGALRHGRTEVHEAAGAALRAITGRDLPTDFSAWSGEIRP